MLSFKEKKAIFHSFHLKEKKISNDRVNFVYPESTQRGQVLATQLHPSGNGYVIGRYMSEDTIKDNGYTLDARGWISIKDFSKEELIKVIKAAKLSMGWDLPLVEAKEVDKKAEVVKIVAVKNLEATDAMETISLLEVEETAEIPEAEKTSEPQVDAGAEQKTEFEYPCLHNWVNLSLSVMNCSLLIWKSVVRRALS